MILIMESCLRKYAHETTDIYKRLLDLWMELQNKYSLSEKDILELKFDEKKINDYCLCIQIINKTVNRAGE